MMVALLSVKLLLPATALDVAVPQLGLKVTLGVAAITICAGRLGSGSLTLTPVNGAPTLGLLMARVTVTT